MDFLIGIGLGVLGTLTMIWMFGSVKSDQAKRKAQLDAQPAKPKSDEQARRLVERAGPTPSDPHLGAFIGDKERERELQKKRDKEVRDHNRAIEKRILAGIKNATPEKDANSLLYFIGLNTKDRFISERSTAALMGWSRARLRKNLEYLLAKRWIVKTETHPTKGKKYRLSAKALKAGVK